MDNKEIFDGLLRGDESTNRQFFFVDCRPLFTSIINNTFSYHVDYDEFVNELYIYLMENEAARLKQFEGRSSLYQWLKVTATRFFIKKRDQLIEDTTNETLIEEEDIKDNPIASVLDVQRLLDAMPNKRYAAVIQKLLIEEYTPEELSAEMHVTTDNLYNLKRRAMMQLMQVALNDIRNYGNK